jgi:hypothetical protein
MSDPKLRMVRSVLHWAWDPIGVAGVAQAHDEYDSYAPAVWQMLEHGSSSEALAIHLGEIERERMGLPPNAEKNADVAGLLKELHALFA